MRFNCVDCQTSKLPDISMYAGDTTPWNITLVKTNGNPYPYASLGGSSAKLTFMPYSCTNGIGADANIVAPALSVTGTISGDLNGTGTAIFALSYSDTIDLYGKYIYQVSISNDDDVRICQGIVTIKHNIDRTDDDEE